MLHLFYLNFINIFQGFLQYFILFIHTQPTSKKAVQDILEKAKEVCVPIAAPGKKGGASKSGGSKSAGAAQAARSAAAAAAAAASAAEVSKEPSKKSAPSSSKAAAEDKPAKKEATKKV